MSNAPPDGGYGKLDHGNTLPVWLQKGGYYTAHIGRYLNGYGFIDTNPNDSIPAWQEIPQGWNEWYGLVAFYLYYNYFLNENGKIVFYGESSTNYQTDVFAQKAVKFIQSRAHDNTPFFLNVAFLSPHDDRFPPLSYFFPDPPGPEPAPRHKGVFSNKPLPQPPSFNEQDMSDKPSFMQALPLLEAPVIESIAISYHNRLESLLSVDEAVARIVKALYDTGKLNNTYIIFTSDNGFFHGEHRKAFDKELPYEESIRVPLIVYFPGLSGGKKISEVVANVDLAPTIVELAQISPGRVMDGRSLVPLLKNNIGWRKSILIESKDYAGVRTDQYIYVEYINGEKEFYDLYVDPYQLQSRHNSSSPVDQQIMTNLQQQLAILRTCFGDSCWQ